MNQAYAHYPRRGKSPGPICDCWRGCDPDYCQERNSFPGSNHSLN